MVGERQIVAVTGESILGVGLEGRLLWKHPWPMEYHINVATPIRVAANRLFVSTSYDVGAVVLEIRKEENGFVAEEIWRNQLMKNHFQDSIYHDGHLYGFDNAFLKCIDVSTGEMPVAWAWPTAKPSAWPRVVDPSKPGCGSARACARAVSGCRCTSTIQRSTC